MGNIKNFGEFLNEHVQDKLWNYQNTPLFGGYIADIDEDIATVFITISKEPVQKGQKTSELDILGEVYYYPDEDYWNWDDSLVKYYASDRDQPILDEIAQKIKSR